MTKLRIRDKVTYLKVVDPYYETICESFLTKGGYAERAKVTLNEMVHSWNESFGKGLDVRTGLPPRLTKQQTKTVFLVEGKELCSLEAVEGYAKAMGKRILLTQTAINSNIYLVTLTK